MIEFLTLWTLYVTYLQQTTPKIDFVIFSGKNKTTFHVNRLLSRRFT